MDRFQLSQAAILGLRLFGALKLDVERVLIDGLLLEEAAIANSSRPRWIEEAEPAAGTSRSDGAASCLGSLSSDTAICTVHNRVRTIKNLVQKNGCWQCRGGFQSCLPAERRRGR